MEQKVYLRLKKKITVDQYQVLTIHDIAHVTGNFRELEDIRQLKIYELTKQDKNVSVIDGFHLIDVLLSAYPNLTFELVGPNQVIVDIKKGSRKASPILIACIWLLLCIGSAMAIMHFHFDVDMKQVHQSLHTYLTGEESEKPLWIQVPYSLGLGIGMILFFNHVFKKRFNEEPSPLEIEMFNYQEDLDQYLVTHENVLNHRNDD
nr:stage V sporulation protein AA [Gracilibacillus halophilus]